MNKRQERRAYGAGVVHDALLALLGLLVGVRAFRDELLDVTLSTNMSMQAQRQQRRKTRKTRADEERLLMTSLGPDHVHPPERGRTTSDQQDILI